MTLSLPMSNEIDMSGPIVCGVDDSAGARNAAVAAVALSARRGLPLIFVHVTPGALRLSLWDRERKHALGESMSIGMELLERTIGRVAHGRDSIIRVAMGKPAERLSIFAASLGAEMVVVGSRRRRLFRARRLGSVSRSLIGLCERPVLVVSPGARMPDTAVDVERGERASVLCGIDASPASRHAAEVASRLAARLDDRLVLAHAYPPLRAGLGRGYESGPLVSRWRAAPTLLDGARASLQHLAGPDPELTLEPGSPRKALVEATKREAAELLVVGSDGLGTPGRRSVAEMLVASCPIPVLVVPAPADLAGTERDQDRGDERLAAA